MRNLWGLMTKFKVLPTNEDFRQLSDSQIDLMIYSMNEDYREMEMAKKGIQLDSQHYDSSFEEEVWNKDVGDWDVLKEGHDPNDIARQVEALTRSEDVKNLASKFDSLDEYNAYLEAGGKTGRETEVEQHINRQIAIAEEKARRIEAAGGRKALVDDRDIAGEGNGKYDLDKEAIDKSIALFNQTNNDDDDYTTL
jgi:hypothetical protein